MTTQGNLEKGTSIYICRFVRLQFIARVNQASHFTHYIRFLRPWSYDIAKSESPSMGLLNVTVWFVQCDSFSDVYCLCMWGG